MLPRRKPLVALAAATATLAIAVPVTSASAAATPAVDPQVCTLLSPASGPFSPTSVVGGASLANVLASARGTVGCPAAAAAQPSLFPRVTWWG